MTDQIREIDHPKVPAGLPEPESKPGRDDEKGGRPALERGNRDRGPEESDEDRSRKVR